MKKIKLVSLVSGRPRSSQRPRQKKPRSSPELRLPLTTHQRTPPFDWNRKAQGPCSLIHQGAARPESRCGMSKCQFRFSQGNLGWTNWSILVIYGDFLYLSSPWDTQWPCSYVKTLFWNDSCILLLFFLRVRVFMSKPYFGLMFVECVFLCHTMSKPNLDAIAGLSCLLSEDQ